MYKYIYISIYIYIYITISLLDQQTKIMCHIYIYAYNLSFPPNIEPGPSDTHTHTPKQINFQQTIPLRQIWVQDPTTQIDGSENQPSDGNASPQLHLLNQKLLAKRGTLYLQYGISWLLVARSGVFRIVPRISDAFFFG